MSVGQVEGQAHAGFGYRPRVGLAALWQQCLAGKLICIGEGLGKVVSQIIGNPGRVGFIRKSSKPDSRGPRFFFIFYLYPQNNFVSAAAAAASRERQ